MSPDPGPRSDPDSGYNPDSLPEAGRRTTGIEPVDWESLSGSSREVPWRLVVFLVGLGALYLLFRYTEARNVGIVYSWSPSPLTWLYRVSLLALLSFGLPSLLTNRDRTRRYLRRLLDHRIAAVSLVFLLAVAVVAQFGPMVLGRPRTDPLVALQPPVGFTSRYGLLTVNCVGPVVGPAVENYCTGTLAYPLGTNILGQDMVTLIVSGMHVSLQVAVITVALMIPVATTVGLVAGYLGGSVDTVLMRYVEVQQSVPAFVIYIILAFAFGSSLFLLVLVFGLLNWGSIARLVRSEVIQRREAQFVDVARSAGVGRLTIIRRHILPNVSNSVVIGATQKIPQLVLLETGLTYIDLGDVGRWFQSFGQTIERGFAGAYGHGATEVWWIWVLPVVVLAAVVVALSLLGDALRDVLDPRGEV